MADDLIKTLDEFQEEYRKGVGTVLPQRPSKEANLDNIRRFGDGVGDYNPRRRALLDLERRKAAPTRGQRWNGEDNVGTSCAISDG